MDVDINSEVRVTPLNTTNTALLTVSILFLPCDKYESNSLTRSQVDSTDLSFEQIHYLQWQTC